MEVISNASGFVTWSAAGGIKDDFSVTISIAANSTGLERIEDFEIRYLLGGDTGLITIPITQNA